MTGFRPRLWPTVFTIPTVLVLLALGTWQVQRLYWKEGLIAQRQAGLAAPTAPWAEAAGNPGAFLWHRVSARGRFLHDREQVRKVLALGGFETNPCLEDVVHAADQSTLYPGAAGRSEEPVQNLTRFSE